MEAVTISNEDVMVSNLPLLFVDGIPTSLECMTTEDLQFFLAFLMKCILGENVTPSMWSKFPRPKWWAKDVPWSSIILSKKYQTLKWQKKLQDLVTACYSFNNCSVLLQFSSNLKQGVSKGWTYRYTDNWDGTTSMYLSPSGKLLVTFRNENMTYDRGFRQSNSSGWTRPMLLPRLSSPTSPTKATKAAQESSETDPPALSTTTSTERMVEPPICDIFLCDYCGAAFSSSSAIKDHEANCSSSFLPESATEPSCPEPDESALDQAKYMWYLGLSGKDQYTPPANVTPMKADNSLTGKHFTGNQRRYTAIPFSSDLGQSLLKSSRQSPSTILSLVERHERHCLAKPANGKSLTRPGDSGSNQWQITYRKVPVQKRQEEWAHLYCFNKRDRQERTRTLSTGLTKRSRLLRAQCRPLRVVLKGLTPSEIRYWLQPKPKPQPVPQLTLCQPPLYLSNTFTPQFLPNLPPDCTITLAPTMAATPANTVLQPPLIIRQVPVPKLVFTAPSSAPPLRPKPTRSPPPLLPLVTSVWSMSHNTAVKKKPHVLPDLIPVSSNGILTPQKPTVPVNNAATITNPAKKKIIIPVESVIRGERKQHRGSITSEEEQELPLSPLPFMLPPGISITKIIRRDRSKQPDQPLQQQQQQHKQKKERNNNFVNIVETQIVEASVSTPPPSLQYMGGATAIRGQYDPAGQPQQTRSSLNQVGSGGLSIRQVPPLIRPFKVNTLPPEKREQMKQSLLKIQREEAKKKHTPSDISAVQEQLPELEIRIISEDTPDKGSDTDGADKRLSLSALSPNLPRDVKTLLLDECRELRSRGLDDLLTSEQRITRRKTARMSRKIGSKTSPVSKSPVKPPSPPAEPGSGDGEDDGPTIIEVDLSQELDSTEPERPWINLGMKVEAVDVVEPKRTDSPSHPVPVTETKEPVEPEVDLTAIIIPVESAEETQTPLEQSQEVLEQSQEVLEQSLELDSRTDGEDLSSSLSMERKRKRIGELSRLLGDECKELKRKGLDALSQSGERVTRRRTKSSSTTSPLPPPASAKKKRQQKGGQE